MILISLCGRLLAEGPQFGTAWKVRERKPHGAGMQG